MGAIEILNSDPLVTSLVMHDDGRHTRIMVRLRGKTVGELMLEPSDATAFAARLLGPQGHELSGTRTILERCVSLVQSMAKRRPRSGLIEASERLEVYEDEADLIAHDAGWT